MTLIKKSILIKLKGGGKLVLSGIGTPELIIIILILVLLFGGKKIPEFIQGIGEALKEFKKASKEKEE